MGLSIYPITPEFAAEVGDLDLSKELEPSLFAEIEQAFWKYAVLIFPGQVLTQEQHRQFALRFGPLEGGSASERAADPRRIHRELTDVSNLEPGEGLWEAQSRKRLFQMSNRLWHTDASFRHIPAYASLLYAREIAPIGGHTEFSDQRAAYDDLPNLYKYWMDDMVAEHSIFHSRGRLGFTDFTAEDRRAMPPVAQVLVRTLPQTQRKCLYLASHAGRIHGMDDEEGREVIDKLIEHSTQRQYVYTHRWRPNDLVLWDNRCTMHRGTDFDDLRWRRDMQRATVKDASNTLEQEGLAIREKNITPAPKEEFP